MKKIISILLVSSIVLLESVCSALEASTLGPMAGGRSAAPPSYFIHVEIGYKSLTGEYCLPNPEYSNPANNRNLDLIEKDINPGIEEKALYEVADILKRNGVKTAIFLVFPYYAERHYSVLKQIANEGFTIGIHIHEDWKQLASADPDKIREYLIEEKRRLEKAIGGNVTIFSYGPGIQLDDMGGKEPSPSCGSLTDEEKIKIFKGILEAGFTKIQTAPEYEQFLPAGLDLLAEPLIGLPHSYELHTKYSTDREGMDRLNILLRKQVF